MDRIDLLEAKRTFSHIVERPSKGERIGITRDGVQLAIVEPIPKETRLREIFDDIEKIRKRVGRHVDVKKLIEYGRT